jgi:hypothetical protein
VPIKSILFILFIIFVFTFCDSSDNIVGTNNDVEINNVSFTIDTTYLQSSVLYAKGTATNLGSTSIQSPWYVEAQFYTDSSYKRWKLHKNWSSIRTVSINFLVIKFFDINNRRK